MRNEFLNFDQAEASGAEGLEVSIINFIDVLLVILLFFMVRDNLTEKTPPLAILASHLTETQGQPVEATPGPATVIKFTGGKEARVFWNNEPIELHEVSARVQDLVTARPDAVILLAGDKDAEYGLSLKIRTLLGQHAVRVKELSQLIKE